MELPHFISEDKGISKFKSNNLMGESATKIYKMFMILEKNLVLVDLVL